MASRSKTPVDQADVNVASNGDNTVIAAMRNHRIYVWKLVLQSHAAVNVKFKHGSTDFNAQPYHFTAEGSDLVFAYDDEPHWICDENTAFIVNLSGAVQVVGRVHYTYERSS